MANPKILTVRHPWAWAIIHGGKNTENRTWVPPGNYRGLLLVHAGQAVDREGFDLVHKLCGEIPDRERFWQTRGMIIGMVEITDCTQDSPSPWAEDGAWHWVLQNPVPARHSLTVRGQLGLREAPPGWERAFR